MKFFWVLSHKWMDEKKIIHLILLTQLKLNEGRIVVICSRY